MDNIKVNDIIILDIKMAQDIIGELKQQTDEFSSHQFIEKFAFYHESAYIDLLHLHKDNHAFQYTHAQIARFLSENQSALGITKTTRDDSINVFGHKTEVQFWR